MTANDFMRKVDDFIRQAEVESRQQEERVRALILARGGPDALADFDAEMKRLRNGTEDAENLWHSISGVQRRLLLAMRAGDGKVARGTVRIATLRNLANRDLIAWDGGAFDPEASAVLTEHGRFVIAHGSQHSCEYCRK